MSADGAAKARVALPRLGVLGGMGPLATADFLRKLVEETPASADEEHIPLIAYSVPQIPSRPASILEGGPTPLPAMLEGLRTLRAAGADAIAIPCHTAHYWYDDLVEHGGMPILHIADAVLVELAARDVRSGTIGLIATKGTLAARFFQRRLDAAGYAIGLNTTEQQDAWVLPAIAAVKRNELAIAHALAVRACDALKQAGADRIVLACTETPLAIDYAPHPIARDCVDATRALAKACVRWWQEARARSSGTPPSSALAPP